MKIDDKVVTMTGGEFEIFSRLIDTINSQDKIIRKLTRERAVRAQPSSFDQMLCIEGWSKKRPLS